METGGLAAHGHVAEVMHVGQAQHLGKLLAQPDLHLVFGGIDAILSQAARLNIAVQDDDFVTTLGDLLRGKHPCRSCANDKDSLHVLSSRLSLPRFLVSTAVRCRRAATHGAGICPHIPAMRVFPPMVFLLSLTRHAHARPSFIHFPAYGHVLLGLFQQLFGRLRVRLP